MNNKIKIVNFINKLKKQINENNNKTYVILTLTKDSDVNDLSDLLQKEFALKLILEQFNRNKAFKDKEGNYWSLCITGFKYGAAKNSTRKIGLLAYKYGQTFNFKSAIFYDSENFSKYYTMNNVTYPYNNKHTENYILNIIELMNYYLETPEKYEPNTNYIKRTITRTKTKTKK